MTALSGRVALVTGASHGTGVDVARDLARAGARVAVHYRSDRAAGEDVAAAIRAEGGEEGNANDIRWRSPLPWLAPGPPPSAPSP